MKEGFPSYQTFHRRDEETRWSRANRKNKTSSKHSHLPPHLRKPKYRACNLKTLIDFSHFISSASHTPEALKSTIRLVMSHPRSAKDWFSVFHVTTLQGALTAVPRLQLLHTFNYKPLFSVACSFF